MRSVIISLILCASCLLGAFTADKAVDANVNHLCGTLYMMEQDIHASDWSSAQIHFDALKNDWHSQQHLWRLLLDHQQLMDLEANLLRIGAYIYAQDDAQGMAELASLYTTYQHTMLLEKVTWDNIL